MKDLIQAFITKENPSQEEYAAFRDYVLQTAREKISGREEEIEEFPAAILEKYLEKWRKQEGGDLWRRVRNDVLTYVLEYRSSLAGEAARPLCDAGMIGEKPLPETTVDSDPVIDPDTPTEPVLRKMEDADQRRKKRAFFLDRLRELQPSVEAVERRGTVEDKLLLRVLRKVHSGEMELEEALGVLLRMKDRDLRASMFQALAEAYERHPFVQAQSMVCYPACGTSQEPLILPPGSPDFEKAQATGRRIFGLTQGELGEVFGFRDSEASLLRREEPDAQLEIAAKTLEEQAKAETEKREQETLERLERVLRKESGKHKNPGTM